MSKNKKIILFIALAVLAVAGTLLFLNKKGNQDNFYPDSGSENKQTESSSASDKGKINFTHEIFDPSKVSHITPMGELNGGYEEAQTINGVMINIKTDANRNASEIPVYAPVDMTLEDYSYFTGGQHTPNWHLGFRISKDLKLSFDHITWVPDELKKVTPPTPTSGYVPPAKALSYKAGDLIAKTSGTDQAHNWNIYMRDNRQKNIFVNQKRYDKVKEGYDYVNAVCPFDYYEDTKKQAYLALMGFSAPGQSKTCGSNSKDVRGSISGLWHLSKDGVGADYQGQYATPFSIYKASSNEIIIYEVDRQRFILDTKNPTYKDPAKITDSHCYSLTEYGGRKPEGYMYFKVSSDQEMKMSFNRTGNCPSAFPENSVTYYR